MPRPRRYIQLGPDEIVEVALRSPMNESDMIFNFPKTGSQNFARSIRLAIWTARTDHVELKHIMKSRDVNTYRMISSLADVQDLSQRFNECVCIYVQSELGQKAIEEKKQEKYSPLNLELIDLVLLLIYSFAIENPSKLNEINRNQSQTYGELDFDAGHALFQCMNLSNNDIFLDLGSGIGNVVLQAALTFHCRKSYGIELSAYRANCAREMLNHFQVVMKWLGRKHGDIELIEGNFLDPKYTEIIQSSNRIFINNLAFDAQINNDITVRLQQLPVNTVYISSVPLVQKRTRNRIIINELQDTMVKVEMIESLPVSWTKTKINFYKHTLVPMDITRIPATLNDPEEQRRGLKRRVSNSEE
ncbi:hypothetical protein GJ496_002538 [Pomphorhynchus laevis]|nr:hypothetical protein GJ496_002538 [Pomphorhynchus laevis]